jgi:hypothetical protein
MGGWVGEEVYTGKSTKVTSVCMSGVSVVCIYSVSVTPLHKTDWLFIMKVVAALGLLVNGAAAGILQNARSII